MKLGKVDRRRDSWNYIGGDSLCDSHEANKIKRFQRLVKRRSHKYKKGMITHAI